MCLLDVGSAEKDYARALAMKVEGANNAGRERKLNNVTPFTFLHEYCVANDMLVVFGANRAANIVVDRKKRLWFKENRI